MKNRLEVAKELLLDDGVIFISIDDDESHYLKILCDEVFTRDNFVANIVWQKKYGPANDAKWLSDSHDHILVFAKNKEIWRPNLLARNEKQLKDFKNLDNDDRGLWRASDLSAKTPSQSCMYPITGPDGSVNYPPKTRSWVFSEQKYNELVVDNRIWFGINGTARPMIKKFLTEVKDGITPETWWNRDLVGDNKIARYENKILFPETPFATPKPEKLLQRIIELATNENDLILDFFSGSGTTAAVAHKMNRRYIGIEQMDYIETISVERLKQVIEGEQGGISKAVGWNGGGSFIYAELRETDTFNEADTIGRLNDNMRYLPISEIDDESYGVSDEEKRLNKQFYGIV
jgi:adenine-specific DNA-methyltransferase